MSIYLLRQGPEYSSDDAGDGPAKSNKPQREKRKVVAPPLIDEHDSLLLSLQDCHCHKNSYVEPCLKIRCEDGTVDLQAGVSVIRYCHDVVRTMSREELRDFAKDIFLGIYT